MQLAQKVAEVLDGFGGEFPPEDAEVILTIAQSVEDIALLKSGVEGIITDVAVREQLQTMYNQVLNLIVRAGFDVDCGKIRIDDD